MTKTTLLIVVLVLLMGGSLVGLAETSALGFGFGGGGVAAFFPDLGGVNAFLSENGLPAMPSFLVGGVGGGRGGVIGGLSLGGMGFGAAGTSASVDVSADLGIGGGGFDLGFAVGGDETSVLTLGAVLGGGASVLALSFPAVQSVDVGPAGIVPVPQTRTIGRAFAMVVPYVSFEAQILRFVGFDVRIGYVVPVFGFDFGEGTGIPAPSLDLAGPFVGVSIEFGGIGRVGRSGENAARVSESGTFDLSGRARLSVESQSGNIVVSSYVYDAAQTASLRTVEWSASYDGDAASATASRVDAQAGPDGASLRTTGNHRVDYVLRVPSGTDLELVDGAGSIHVVGHSAALLRIALGAGDVSLTDVDAGEMSVSVGAGDVVVSATAIGSLNAHAGVGQIRLDLPPDVSATVSASVGLGEVAIEGFANMVLHERGLLWTKSSDAVLGSGGSDYSLSVGIGQIEVHPAALSATKPQ